MHCTAAQCLRQISAFTTSRGDVNCKVNLAVLCHIILDTVVSVIQRGSADDILKDHVRRLAECCKSFFYIE